MTVFQSTHSLARMRRYRDGVGRLHSRISIHALPRKNATRRGLGCAPCTRISIHALPRKNATPNRNQNASAFLTFQSTHSLARMRQRLTAFGSANRTFQSTHSLARMRQKTIGLPYHFCPISIHALPRKNATLLAPMAKTPAGNFNPRTPSQECDKT